MQPVLGSFDHAINNPKIAQYFEDRYNSILKQHLKAH
jgi:hypothetical protein